MAEQEKNTNNEVEIIVENIKKLVQKGNVAKIVIKKDEEIILNLPLNAGIVGGIIGAVAAPWALVATAIATVGFDCRIELIKDDGEVIDISGKIFGKKEADVVEDIVADIVETPED